MPHWCTADSTLTPPCMVDSSSLGACHRLGYDATNKTQQGWPVHDDVMTPLTEWYRHISRPIMAQYVQIRHRSSINQKFTAYCKAARGGLSQGSEQWRCSSGDMAADRHTHYNTLLPYCLLGKSNEYTFYYYC